MLGFIEGSMEREFVGRNFKYVRISPVYNGVSWTTDRLSKQIVASYKAFNLKTRTVIWVDREGRAESAEEIATAIADALVEAGADPDDVFVLVNDRMAENVILADEDIIRTEFEKADYEYAFEGQNGKFHLRRFYRERGGNYRELVQGVELLKKVRLKEAAVNSPSVARFLEKCSFECWWFERPQHEVVA